MLRKKKILAGGTFSIIHPGHIHFLEEAKKLGNRLVVVVASDRTVLRNQKKLLHPARERAERINVLSFVDKTVIGDDNDMSRVIREEKPDVIAIGYDQDDKMVRKLISMAGVRCEVVRIEKLKGYSTKKITEGKK
ncbi:MAG: adenylyltransferase/cytidyltransferase family protein [Candidatus Aenigmatarchaeota archaeon]|nr:MAG: adenylyltransferase/cytidyltransferase family protein [Candidatus Aenigmarchaeota archaeon]